MGVVTLGVWKANLQNETRTMKPHLIFLLGSLLVATSAWAQTRIIFTEVRALDRQDSLHGNDVTIQLNRAEGKDNTVLLSAGDVTVKVRAKVKTHSSPRSSLKDSAVNLTLDLFTQAGKGKDSKRVEKIFYLDQSRSGSVTQRFNFKNGLDMRPLTLSFKVTIE